MKIIDVEAVFQVQTKNGGVCVRAEEEGEDIWLAASLIELDPREPLRGAVVVVTLPQWLAEEKGLI